MNTETSNDATATSQIIASLSDAIVGHRLHPGTKLTEQKLADIYGVSRTIVRQALAQLARDKLVVLQAFKGASVASPSVEEARQVFASRRLIETAIIAQLAGSINSSQISVLRKHLKLEQDALKRTDVPGRTRLLGDFHTLLAQQSGNEVLAEIVAELASRTSVVSMLYQSNRSAQCSNEEHAGLLEALSNKDAKTCVKLMREHLDNVERNLRLDPRSSNLDEVLQVPKPPTKLALAVKSKATAKTKA